MADIFSYSFDTTAKNQLDNSNTADPDAARSDVSRAGDWTTSNGRGWQITSDANYSGGLGGLGFRFWRGDGENNVSGTISCSLPGSYTELWFRFYMRYQSGFAWTGDNPGYTKEIYGDSGGNYWIYGIQNTGWGISLDSAANNDGFPNAYTFADLMGGATGDGQWHCHEFHIKKGNGTGVIEVWLDNVQRVNLTGLTLGTATMNSFNFGSNQTTVTGAGAADYYTDYDDFVISDSGRVGPLSGGGQSYRRGGGLSAGGLG